MQNFFDSAQAIRECIAVNVEFVFGVGPIAVGSNVYTQCIEKVFLGGVIVIGQWAECAVDKLLQFFCVVSEEETFNVYVFKIQPLYRGCIFFVYKIQGVFYVFIGIAVGLYAVDQIADANANLKVSKDVFVVFVILGFHKFQK